MVDIKRQQAYTTLTNGFKSNKLHHAYLLSGINVTEVKVETAYFFTQMLLCQNENKPCQTCLNCLQVRARAHPDLKWFEETKPISKDMLQALMHDFNKSGLVGENKVYVIEDVTKMSNASFNTWLKFLEEPPKGVYVIAFCSTDQVLLPTIASRFVNLRVSSDDVSEATVIGEVAYNVLTKIQNNEKFDEIYIYINNQIDVKTQSKMLISELYEACTTFENLPLKFLSSLPHGFKMIDANVSSEQVLFWILLKLEEQ